MEQSGILNKLRDKYFGDVFGPAVQMTEATKVVLGFDNVLFPFLILCIGFPFTVIIAVCEKIKHCLNPNKVLKAM